MTATFYVGDAIEVMNTLPARSVDLVLSSPPFLSLRSYLPNDHPDKGSEIGSEPTPGAFIDRLLDVVEACARVLAPHGSLVFELGDTYAGSGGAGGDYNPGGWREGQEGYRQHGRVEGRVYDAKHGNAGIWNLDGKVQGGGRGWPLAKSLSLIPESFRWAMVYGHNPFTGRKTEPWRLRNVIRWVRPNPPVGALCVDDQTEALTLDGWKRHDQLTDGDLVAAYDLKTDSIRFLPATFTRYEREGEPMVVVDKKATSQWLTEYHRCLVRTVKGGVHVRLAQDLSNSCDTLLCAPFEDVPGPAAVTATRAALLGWYVAEGSPRHRQSRIVQSQTANPQKVAEIRRLLEADGADFTESVYRHPYNDSDIVTFTIKGELAEWLNLHHHRLPMMYATTWPEVQAQALFDALIDGDGHRRKNAEGMLFHQQEESIADVVQTLAIRLGYRASKSWQPSMNIWQVTIGTRSRWTAIRKWEGTGIRREAYTGTVWCPQVETGFWLARRNGKTFITGNSDKFRPATSELMVFCKAKDRYFDLDAVRESPKEHSLKYDGGTRPIPDSDPRLLKPRPGGDMNPAGAPPLDWWNIPLLEGEEPTKGGPTERPLNRPAQGAPKETQARKDGVVRGAMVERTYHKDGGAPPLDWWNIPPGGYPGAHYACVDETTEALTPDGWKDHKQLEDGDLIGAYDLRSDRILWQPAKFVRYDVVDEPLVCIEKEQTSQRLTDTHRMLVKSRKRPEPFVKLAGEVTSGYDLPLSAPWGESGSVNGPGTVFAALLGWFITEGSARLLSRQAYIYQSKTANSDKVDRIRQLLEWSGAPFDERVRDRGNEFPGKGVQVSFVIQDSPLAAWLRDHHKRLPLKYVFDWPEKDAQALFDAMVDGDGHRRADGRISFVQKDKELADAFQCLAIRLGYRATVKPRRDNGIFTVYVSVNRWVTLRGPDGKRAPIPREAYTGVVWCPQVDATFWLARRNGKPFITGNTWPPELLIKPIKAMCPSRVCRVCGEPSRRIVESESFYLNGEPTKGGRLANRAIDGGLPLGHGNATTTNVRTLGFTDCGHDEWVGTDRAGGNYRPGLVLDPFGGSGTTALVATGHGRDAILIDLDERNFDLALDRVGPLVLSRGEVAA